VYFFNVVDVYMVLQGAFVNYAGKVIANFAM
jgi:hypothetical protein